MALTTERVTFAAKCGNCGAECQQDWPRETLQRELWRDTLQLLCVLCGKGWHPDPEEQASLMKYLFPDLS